MKRISILLLMWGTLGSTAVLAEEEGLVSKAEKGVTAGAQAAAKGIEKGASAAARGVQIGVDATGRGLKKAGEWVEQKLGKPGDKPAENP